MQLIIYYTCVCLCVCVTSFTPYIQNSYNLLPVISYVYTLYIETQRFQSKERFSLETVSKGNCDYGPNKRPTFSPKPKVGNQNLN